MSMSPAQAEAHRLRQQGLSHAEIGAEMGKSENAINKLLRRARKWEDEDPAISAAMQAVNTNMRPALAWAKTKSEDGTSYSVLLRPEALPDSTLDRIREAFEGMAPAAPVAPPAATMAALCTLYPLMDVHLGMHAWGKETAGDDYDLKHARDDMALAFGKIDALTPASAEAVLVVGGDFFHADDTRAETPQHKHKLDVDGRHFKVLDEGVKILASVIDRLLRKHGHLTVHVIPGNHDLHSHMVLTFALAERYREEPRVSVEKTPRPMFMKQWGRTAIFAHHGDRMKPQQMVNLLCDICPFWSETRHRHVFTGHIHHDSAKDFGCLKWESLRAFCPPDAYAASMGYPARRAMQAITFHDTDGLVLRALDPIERAA